MQEWLSCTTISFFWDNRQYPRVYDAFVDVWGREDLWVTIDRVNFNLPPEPGIEFKGFMHWDYRSR